MYRNVIRFRTVQLAAVVSLALLIGLRYGEIDYQIEPMASWDLVWYRHMAAAAPV
jgi:hypothetical protein